MTTESSVLVNLKDLFTMESERREHEARVAERSRAEAEVRRLAEEREREDALRAAREEERTRLEQERTARDADTQARLSALRSELEQVRDQRAQLQVEMHAIAARSGEPVPAKRGWVAGGLAGLSLATALVATAMAWPHPQSMQELAQPSAVVALESPSTPVEQPVVVAPQTEVTPAVAPVVTPVARTTRVRVRTHTEPTQQDMLRDLDREGDSVLSDEFLRNADEHVRCPRGHHCR